MSPHGNGVSELLRHASDDLSPDVEQLVLGGITRGRSRQRRARIGTAVASFAVIGVVGGLTAVVPQLMAPDRAGSDVAAGDGATESPREPMNTSAMVAPTAPDPTITAADIPGAVDGLLGTSFAGPPLTGPGFGVADLPGKKVVHFLYRGMLTSVIIERPVSSPKPDGTTDAWGPDKADGVTAQGVTYWREGYQIDVLSYNAADGKESPVLQPEPALSPEQLLLIASSEVWFRLPRWSQQLAEPGLTPQPTS